MFVGFWCNCAKKVRSHRYTLGKEESILILFLDNCRYSLLILHQNFVSDGFLEINSHKESESQIIAMSVAI